MFFFSKLISCSVSSVTPPFITKPNKSHKPKEPHQSPTKSPTFVPSTHSPSLNHMKNTFHHIKNYHQRNYMRRYRTNKHHHHCNKAEWIDARFSRALMNAISVNNQYMIVLKNNNSPKLAGAVHNSNILNNMLNRIEKDLVTLPTKST